MSFDEIFDLTAGVYFHLKKKKNGVVRKPFEFRLLAAAAAAWLSLNLNFTDINDAKYILVVYTIKYLRSGPFIPRHSK